MATTTKAKADPKAELAKILAGLEKKLGPGSVHKGSEVAPVNHLPFLEPNLNYATEGGAPFGRFMAMYGDESVGKTRVAYELIAMLQTLPRSAEVTMIPRIAYHSSRADDTQLSDELRSRHDAKAKRLQEELDWIRETFPSGAEAVFYNAEQQFDPLYARRIGIDTDRLLVIESTTIEEIVEAMENLYAHYAMHVVDSTSSASSLLSQKDEVGRTGGYGTDARQWKISLRDSMRFFDPARNMGVLIHQMTTNMRTGGGQAQSTRYLRHTSSCSIKFTRQSFLYDVDGVLKDKKPDGLDAASMSGIAEPDGCEVYAKIEKSRTCRPHRNAGLQFHYKRLHFVLEHELAASALYYGMAAQSGSWFYKVDAQGEQHKVGQGLKALYAALREDQSFRADVQCRLLDMTAEV